ncbi:Hpt domain-containing protein [Alkalimarinus sediminis]|uniref:Hpt domain-containing protein n=1 Tax=Alkalimarinus sediminis TaxID=1632866 RepID=A0A9E8KRS8_9ALTE|nr:Hpt domain-containing protein [Alkalimarinus sediminis]UZW76745.1 Hpt domain-containing protein [Alkalimarinus sediminis]
MSDNIEHLDLSALAELKEVMEEEFDILLETFLHDSAERVIQIKEAMKAQDAEALSRAAHSFKGSCTNIGVPILAKLCMEAEQKGKQNDLEGIEELVGSIEQSFTQVTQLLKEHLS